MKLEIYTLGSIITCLFITAAQIDFLTINVLAFVVVSNLARFIVIYPLKAVTKNLFHLECVCFIFHAVSFPDKSTE